MIDGIRRLFRIRLTVLMVAVTFYGSVHTSRSDERPPWLDPGITGIHREAPRAVRCVYPDVATAGSPSASGPRRR